MSTVSRPLPSHPAGLRPLSSWEPRSNLTAAVNRLFSRFGQGNYKQVAADALQELQKRGDGRAEPVRFRVGMFFEDVTLNMLRLFSDYWAGTTCNKTLVQELENELKALESELKVLKVSGGGNGAVFGRGAVAAVRKRCNA